jgi:hypothetical protein
METEQGVKQGDLGSKDPLSIRRDQPPPVHEVPEQAPQPLQGLVEQVRQGRLDVGALIARTDAIESTVHRVDRQTIMLVGALALVLWSTRQALVKLAELEGKLEV